MWFIAFQNKYLYETLIINNVLTSQTCMQSFKNTLFWSWFDFSIGCTVKSFYLGLQSFSVNIYTKPSPSISVIQLYTRNLYIKFQTYIVFIKTIKICPIIVSYVTLNHIQSNTLKNQITIILLLLYITPIYTKP